jgi:hypothetical protein
VKQSGVKQAVARAGSVREDRYVPANRRVVISAIAADPRNLGGVLIDLNSVGLMGIGRAMNARERSVRRIEHRDRGIYLRPGEEAVAAITGAIVAGVDCGMLRRVQPRCG